MVVFAKPLASPSNDVSVNYVAENCQLVIKRYLPTQSPELLLARLFDCNCSYIQKLLEKSVSRITLFRNPYIYILSTACNSIEFYRLGLLFVYVLTC